MCRVLALVCAIFTQFEHGTFALERKGSFCLFFDFVAFVEFCFSFFLLVAFCFFFSVLALLEFAACALVFIVWLGIFVNYAR